MKKVIEGIKLFSISISIITIILTMLNSYHIIWIKYFDSYLYIEVCLLITTILGAMQTCLSRNRKSYKRIFSIYILMAMGTIFFIIMKVY